jgi:predicted transcriptional regulator
MITLTLDPEIEQRLDALGARDDASKSELARQALREALADLDDAREALERWQSPERSWSLDELEREDDLAG